MENVGIPDDFNGSQAHTTQGGGGSGRRIISGFCKVQVT